MICPRCTKQTDGVHTCTPTEGWRKLEKERDELLIAVADHVTIRGLYMQQRDNLLSAAERCYRMLLTEPDTQLALSKAENILREMIADAKESK